MRTLPHLSREKIAMCAILLAMLILGGASRADAMSQAFVRTVAIVGLVAAFWNWRQTLSIGARPLVWLLAGWTGLMALQLIPLPPGIRSMFSGREMLAEFYEIMKLDQPWHPFSIQPYLTFNSLLAMLVPWAALLIASRLRNEDFALEVVLLAFLTLSVVLGMLQIASGGRKFYFYEITNIGSAVGLFSNRNHNAFTVTMIIPLLTCILLRRNEGRVLQPTALAVLGGISFAVLINILMIGSRMGLALWVLALLGSWAIAWDARPAQSRRRRSSAPKKARHPVISRTMLLAGSGVAAVAAIIAVLILYAERFTAFQRLAEGQAVEGRLQFVPAIIEGAEKFMPFGAGFGTFPTVFKIVEPDEALRLSYLNHAHNDLLEIVVEGGVFTIGLLVVFMTFWIRRSFVAFKKGANEKGGDEPARQKVQARLGSLIVAILLIGSLSDYPLRTPACAAIFLIACYWLFRSDNEPSPRSAAPLTIGK